MEETGGSLPLLSFLWTIWEWSADFGTEMGQCQRSCVFLPAELRLLICIVYKLPSLWILEQYTNRPFEREMLQDCLPHFNGRVPFKSPWPYIELTPSWKVVKWVSRGTSCIRQCSSVAVCHRQGNSYQTNWLPHSLGVLGAQCPSADIWQESSCCFITWYKQLGKVRYFDYHNHFMRWHPVF